MTLRDQQGIRAPVPALASTTVSKFPGGV